MPAQALNACVRQRDVVWASLESGDGHISLQVGSLQVVDGADWRLKVLIPVRLSIHKVDAQGDASVVVHLEVRLDLRDP